MVLKFKIICICLICLSLVVVTNRNACAQEVNTSIPALREKLQSGQVTDRRDAADQLGKLGREPESLSLN